MLQGHIDCVSSAPLQSFTLINARIHGWKQHWYR